MVYIHGGRAFGKEEVRQLINELNQDDNRPPPTQVPSGGKPTSI
jgi:hypothetical protein